MAEHITPEVYTKEMNSHPRIEMSPTSIAALVGTFESGPLNEPLEVLSLAEFKSNFGDHQDGSGFAVEQFFANGARRCFVVRIRLRGDDHRKTLAVQAGINSLDKIDDFNLLCLPCASDIATSAVANVVAAAGEYCKQRRVFFLVDPPATITNPEELLQWLNDNPSVHFDNAALYYPWVKIAGQRDAQGRPPSGTIAGMIARVDDQRGVWKAPAGHDAGLKGITALEYPLTEQENALLNSHGINCLRQFPDVGPVSWGARTLSQNPDWKYVPVRRFALLLETSLQDGLQWTVIEPNNQNLWNAVRQNIEAFLNTFFLNGALMGTKVNQAYFVKCDRTTMTQNDIDNGRCICVIGFAPLKPAEFVIIRIELLAAEP